MGNGEFDVIVVGAGTAGTYAAYYLASHDLKVALIERKDRDEIGHKICGDAIGKHHFDNLKLNYPSGDELEGIFRGVKIVSPNEEYSLIVEGEGFAINRYEFGQRLLKMAINAGAILYDNRHVTYPIVRNNYVVGVKALNLTNRNEELFKAKVVIDASGMACTVRMKLPNDWWITEKIKPDETNICYREIIKTENNFDTNYAIIFLSKKIAPGGYWWLFPKKSNLINIGLGVQPIDNHPNPIDQYKKYIETRSELKANEKIDAGGGVVPTRRPIYCPVGNGIIAIGDAAFTCNPIHGGGIGPSMVSAKHAAETIIQIFNDNSEPSIKSLWPYTLKYLNDYGLKQASLDVFRMFLQKLTDEDLNFAFKRKVITGDEINIVGRTGELKLSVERKLYKALKLISKPTILFKLRIVRNYMRRMKQLYQKYPEKPEGFINWRNKVESLINEFISKL